MKVQQLQKLLENYPPETIVCINIEDHYFTLSGNELSTVTAHQLQDGVWYNTETIPPAKEILVIG